MMDKKSFSAVVVSIFVFTAYSYYLQVKYPDYYAGQMLEQQVAEQNKVEVQPPVANTSNRNSDKEDSKKVDQVLKTKDNQT